MNAPIVPKPAKAKAKPKPKRKAKPRGGPNGRPTKYLAAYPEMAKLYCAKGATNKELAALLQVSEKSIEKWWQFKPEFKLAVEQGREDRNTQVERALFERATGYTVKAEKVFQYQGEVVRARVTEHYPPDTAAIQFYLKNRKPEEWRDVQQHEHSGEIVHSMIQERLIEGRKRLALVGSVVPLPGS